MPSPNILQYCFTLMSKLLNSSSRSNTRILHRQHRASLSFTPQFAVCCCCSNKTCDLDQEPTANTLALTMRNFIIFQYHALLTHFNVFKNISPNWWSHYKVQLFSCQFWSSPLDNIIVWAGCWAHVDGICSKCQVSQFIEFNLCTVEYQIVFDNKTILS